MFNPLNLDENEIKDILEKKEKIDEFKYKKEVQEFKKRYGDYINELKQYERDERKKLSLNINELNNEIMDLKCVIKQLENDKINVENNIKIFLLEKDERLNDIKYENVYIKTKMENDFSIIMRKLENERKNKLNELELNYKKIKFDIEDIKTKKKIKELQLQNEKEQIKLNSQKKHYELDKELMAIKNKKKKIKESEKLKLNELHNIRIIETEKINGEEKLIIKNLMYNRIKYELSTKITNN